mmetsp:Transcript_24998/g.57538  ORF Transcript_24998/g.57538 Transcript_24998/m.57538 type:complete len:587 (-) Transcript_24998:78-1838(-)
MRWPSQSLVWVVLFVSNQHLIIRPVQSVADTSGDVDVVVMSQANNPEWSATCAADLTFPQSQGFCNTLQGPGGPSNGQQLQLGLQYPLAMVKVNTNQVILCDVVRRSPALVECKVLVREGSSLRQSSAGALTVREAAASDVDVTELEPSVRYLACYIFDSSGTGVLECAALTMAGSSLNKGSTLTIAGNNTLSNNGPASVQVVPLQTNKALVCYNGQQNAATCTTVRYENSTLVQGTPEIIQDGRVKNLVAADIFDEKAIACYAAGSSFDQETCVVLQSAAGSSSVSSGSKYVVSDTHKLGAATMAKLGAQQAGLCYVATGEASALCHSLTANGKTITRGPDHTYTVQDNSRLALAGLSADRQLLCVKNQDLANKCSEISGLLSGTGDTTSTTTTTTTVLGATSAPTTVAATTAGGNHNSNHNVIIIAPGSSAPAPAPANININNVDSNSNSNSDSNSNSNSNGRRRNGGRRRRRKSTTTTEMPWGLPWWGYFLVVNIPLLVGCICCWSACVGGWCNYSKTKKKQAKGSSVAPGQSSSAQKKALLDDRDQRYYNSRKVKRYDDYSSSSGSGSTSSTDSGYTYSQRR